MRFTYVYLTKGVHVDLKEPLTLKHLEAWSFLTEYPLLKEEFILVRMTPTTWFEKVRQAIWWFNFSDYQEIK